jgi:hypothetical protein
MNIIISACLSLILSALLSGCTYNPIVNIESDVTFVSNASTDEFPNVDKVIVKDTSYTHTNWKSYIYYISAVNGKSLDSAMKKTYSTNYGLWRSMKIKLNDHFLPAGNVTLTIKGSTYIPVPMESIGNNSSLSGDIQIELEAGKRYRVNGTLYDGQEGVWIEDEEGKRLTGELTPTPKKERYNRNLSRFSGNR